MPWVLPFARILLAGVFATAGLAKAVNLAGSRKAIADFGVPMWLSGLVGSLLPVIELAIAALLIPGWLSWWAALAALLLLSAFVIAIAVNLLLGRTPDCNCFGHIKPTPIGWTTVVRNILLACGAGVIVSAGQGSSNTNVVSALATASALRPMVVLIVSAVLVVLSAETFVLWHLFRQNGRLLVRIDALEGRLSGGDRRMDVQGLPVGDAAPAFELPATSGVASGLRTLRQRGTAILLLFTDPHCQPCAALLPEIARWQQDYADRLSVAVISRGDEAVNRALAERHGLSDVLVQRGNEVADAYRVVATPAGVLLRADGTIGAPPALGQEAIVALFQTPDEAHSTTGAAARGDLVPNFG